MPDLLWAKALGIDMVRLERERPTDSFQQQLQALQTKRAEAFAEFTRHRRTNSAYLAEKIAWERYCGLTRTVCDLSGVAMPVDIMKKEADRRRDIGATALSNICARCGFVWNQRQPRFIGGLCSSCLALQEKVLRRGRLACQPWQGRFAVDDVTPVNAAGAAILPGYRYCGHSDCVNPKHIRKGKARNE